MFSVWLIDKQGKPHHALDVDGDNVSYEQVEALANSLVVEMNGALESSLTSWIVINNQLTTIDEAIVG